ncbi:methylated-DNA--[protein]-cysteine S-methyltransferase [Ketogulonicigenium vulgare]|uniref:methylated-DNA--[protein]-cysteine S-methyltransferase n=1 Tax=Ketogulonicigenium vulgare (strain WSH-001) TaxID=759362 RepID=F9Y7I4_KETVW|nr:methylated-DNA--[protein]-cysteine S-methyltransferase [Ketogulonicigenium vulgare]ADO41290.1 ADA regulatory protein [Ketogulonicigenium vulgare Y25]AEM42280.1 Transcriptional regulator Ada, AraC family protein [Ketogulonicigenium vulgare WSH-001]ALJ79899.1 6-O-methylguanine DNA methyltransferase [Ketogulonicigenium vulgare]ANW32799.1 6-O-methylguanine DNA methyltransferase [Ketogulonicigenium vulgare]AOZ53116.1 ADA regulatory protein [Ketogulonicigenium vulgare]
METHEPYHYGLIARAIAALDAGGADMSLDDLAAKLGLSPAHLQRVFTRWAGISPKKYQQFLRANLARDLLASRHTTLDTAAEAGLSGTGRLHDLILQWEGMTPGAYAAKGAGVTIRHGLFDTPFGPAIVMATDQGICGIGFTSHQDPALTYRDLASRWPNADFQQDGRLDSQVQAAFSGGPARLHMIGAPFQIKVWEALLAIPEGQVTTYGDIARRIGNPAAVRAVGTAVGRNPIAYLIPCHRVLRRDGGMGGYHWGLDSKRHLLTFEAARTEPPVISRVIG